MKTSILFQLVFILCFSENSAFSQKIEWIKTFNVGERNTILAFTCTSDNGFIIVGEEYKNQQDPQWYDKAFFLKKFDSTGILQWKTYIDKKINVCKNIIGYNAGSYIILVDHYLSGGRTPCLIVFDETGKINKYIDYRDKVTSSYTDQYIENNPFEIIKGGSNDYFVIGSVSDRQYPYDGFGYSLHLDNELRLLNETCFLYDQLKYNDYSKSWTLENHGKTATNSICLLSPSIIVAAGHHRFIYPYIAKAKSNDTLAYDRRLINLKYSTIIKKIIKTKKGDYFINGSEYKAKGFVAELDSNFVVKWEVPLKLQEIDLFEKDDGTMIVIGSNYKKNKKNLFIGITSPGLGISTQKYFDIPMYSIGCFFSKSPNGDIFMIKSDGIARISFSGL